MVKCQTCGEEAGDSLFCNVCGSKIVKSHEENDGKSLDKQEKKFCSNCGSEMKADATFCSKCGTHEIDDNSSKKNNLIATFNPGTAFLLSLYTTGAGHIYLGLFKRGISFLLIQVVLIVLVILFTYIFLVLFGFFGIIVGVIGILLFLVLHILSIYDAFKAINKTTAGEVVEDKLAFNGLL